MDNVKLLDVLNDFLEGKLDVYEVMEITGMTPTELSDKYDY